MAEHRLGEARPIGAPRAKPGILQAPAPEHVVIACGTRWSLPEHAAGIVKINTNIGARGIAPGECREQLHGITRVAKREQRHGEFALDLVIRRFQRGSAAQRSHCLGRTRARKMQSPEAAPVYGFAAARLLFSREQQVGIVQCSGIKQRHGCGGHDTTPHRPFAVDHSEQWQSVGGTTDSDQPFGPQQRQSRVAISALSLKTIEQIFCLDEPSAGQCLIDRNQAVDKRGRRRFGHGQ